MPARGSQGAAPPDLLFRVVMSWGGPRMSGICKKIAAWAGSTAACSWWAGCGAVPLHVSRPARAGAKLTGSWWRPRVPARPPAARAPGRALGAPQGRATHTHKHTHTRLHLRHTHTHTRARARARTHARTRTRAHARTRARTHALARTRTHAHTHAHTHAPTHAHTHGPFRAPGRQVAGPQGRAGAADPGREPQQRVCRRAPGGARARRVRRLPSSEWEDLPPARIRGTRGQQLRVRKRRHELTHNPKPRSLTQTSVRIRSARSLR